MQVELGILSGPRQGDRIRLEKSLIQIGDTTGCDVFFDPQADRRVRGKRLELAFDGERWLARNLGAGIVLVNQDVLEDGRQIRSGDVLRLSEEGPELAFTLVEEKKPPAPTPAPPTAPSPVVQRSAAADQPPRLKGPALARGIAAAGAGVAVLALIALAWGLLRPSPRATPTLQLQPVPKQFIREGERLTIDLEVTGAGVSPQSVQYSLGPQPPEGMHIDPQRGRITWTPTEKQGPNDYEVLVRATAEPDTQRLSDTQTIAITVREVNSPPVLDAIADVELDPNSQPSLDLLVQARDEDIPAGRLTYALGPGSPAGIQIDPASGWLHWMPATNQTGATYRITVEVSDNGNPPLTSRTAFQVTVKQLDPWQRMARELRPCVYLLIAEQPNTGAVFPYGTACAISPSVLLTSASLAVELEKRRRAGWPVRAVAQDGKTKLDIRAILVHFAYNRLQTVPEERIFFDLALVQVDREVSAVATPAGFDQVRALRKGQSLSDLVIAHEGKPLTRFDRPAAQLVRGRIAEVSTMAADEDNTGAPRLLHLEAPFGPYPYGSPIVLESGKVIGVYAERAEIPDEFRATYPDGLHYAPVTALVTAWRAGMGVDQWVGAELPEGSSENQQPESPE